jgi:predicted nuclease with TOPRIM domain
MRKLKEENEDLCERLAFVEGEADDYRNELNTERERHREEIEELRGDVNVLTTKLSQREEELELLKVDMSNVEEEKKGGEEGDDDAYAHIGDVRGGGDDEIFDSTPAPSSDERDEYIKTLEEELELVTEQLIEAETKLSRTQVELDEALAESGYNITCFTSQSTGAYSSDYKVQRSYCVVYINDYKSILKLLFFSIWVIVLSHHFALGLLSYFIKNQSND